MRQPALPELPIEPIRPDEAAWLVAKCNEIDRLVSGVEIEEQDEAPPAWPVIFLDLDDVLCINEHFGGFDAFDAVRGKRIDAEQVYAHLWSPMAVTLLRELHERFGGRLRYVCSSTWRLHYNRAQLREVMLRSGLAFVADRMEPLARWATPHLSTTRAEEVLAWLCEHHRGEPFVIIDDEYSGSDFRTYTGPRAELLRRRVVLCKEWQGLWPAHVPRLVAALMAPCSR
jgi:hypothetical protein